MPFGETIPFEKVNPNEVGDALKKEKARAEQARRDADTAKLAGKGGIPYEAVSQEAAKAHLLKEQAALDQARYNANLEKLTGSKPPIEYKKVDMKESIPPSVEARGSKKPVIYDKPSLAIEPDNTGIAAKIRSVLDTLRGK